MNDFQSPDFFGIVLLEKGADSFQVKGPLPDDSFLTYLYCSVVTFTTPGFGDITPKTTTAAILVMLEVVLGYIMLGGLVSIFATLVARRF